MRWLALAPLPMLFAAAAPADERDFMVTGFDRLRVDGPFEVEVVPGSPGAVATGDARALDRVALRVEGSTLIVNAGTRGWDLRAGEGAGGVQVRVTVPSLRGVQMNGGARVRVAEMEGARVDLGLNGAGSLDVGRVEADDLNVALTGTGAIAIGGGSAGRARVRSYGAGSVDAAGLTAREATLISESSGEISMTVRYTARATALGSGGVHVLGKPECTLRGPGPIECGGTVVRR